MKIIRLLSFCGFFITSLAYASDGFILVQATSSDNSARSSSLTTLRVLVQEIQMIKNLILLLFLRLSLESA